ncbi:unnamed protein product, partial [Cyprideis torosa]
SRQTPRPLRKEFSLDTYTWQKRYGQITKTLQTLGELPRRLGSTSSLEDVVASESPGTIILSEKTLKAMKSAERKSQLDNLRSLWTSQIVSRQVKRSSLTSTRTPSTSSQTPLISSEQTTTLAEGNSHESTSGVGSMSSHEGSNS